MRRLPTDEGRTGNDSSATASSSSSSSSSSVCPDHMSVEEGRGVRRAAGAETVRSRTHEGSTRSSSPASPQSELGSGREMREMREPMTGSSASSGSSAAAAATAAAPQPAASSAGRQLFRRASGPSSGAPSWCQYSSCACCAS
eukprot:scaffold43129_cov24-Phaeocystis_antarctica.AAC.1